MRRAKRLCGPMGCAGKGVLDPPVRAKQTATSDARMRMIGATPDLQRATANAMLGVGAHPYRLLKGLEQPTASSKMFRNHNASSMLHGRGGFSDSNPPGGGDKDNPAAIGAPAVAHPARPSFSKAAALGNLLNLDDLPPQRPQYEIDQTKWDPDDISTIDDDDFHISNQIAPSSLMDEINASIRGRTGDPRGDMEPPSPTASYTSSLNSAEARLMSEINASIARKRGPPTLASPPAVIGQNTMYNHGLDQGVNPVPPSSHVSRRDRMIRRDRLERLQFQMQQHQQNYDSFIATSDNKKGDSSPQASTGSDPYDPHQPRPQLRRVLSREYQSIMAGAPNNLSPGAFARAEGLSQLPPRQRRRPPHFSPSGEGARWKNTRAAQRLGRIKAHIK